MKRKIIGVTVGTSISPNTMKSKMGLSKYAKSDWVEETFQQKGNFLTEEQLPQTINEALAQAKASGEFDGKDGVDGKNGVDGYSPVRGKDYWTSTDRQSIVTDMLTSEEVRKMQQDILDLRADLEYVPIDITSISSTVTKAEMGSVVNKVTISWVVNKTPNVQTLDGSEVAVNLRSVALTDQGIAANKTFIVTATDERNTTDTASTSITFLNGVYYGAEAAPETLDSVFIRSLTKELSNTRGRTITVNAADGKNIWYALPTRLGACNFSVGGFSGGFDLVNTIQFTNASGYTESYYVYASAKTGLGETKVVVS